MVRKIYVGDPAKFSCGQNFIRHKLSKTRVRFEKKADGRIARFTVLLEYCEKCRKLFVSQNVSKSLQDISNIHLVFSESHKKPVNITKVKKTSVKKTKEAKKEKTVKNIPYGTEITFSDNPNRQECYYSDADIDSHKTKAHKGLFKMTDGSKQILPYKRCVRCGSIFVEDKYQISGSEYIILKKGKDYEKDPTEIKESVHLGKKTKMYFLSNNPDESICIDHYGHKLEKHKMIISGRKISKEKVVECQYCIRCKKRFLSAEAVNYIRSLNISSLVITNDCSQRINDDILEKSRKNEPVNLVSNQKQDVENIKTISPKSKKHNRRVSINPEAFITRSSMMGCTRNNHELEHVFAIVGIIRRDGTISETKFPAFYCNDCHRYYILESEFRMLKARGVILCKVVDEKYWSESSKSFGYLSPESLLHILGYNVSESYGLTQQQRWKLLETIVDNRIISKTKIVDHLNMLCRLNGGRSSMENAVHKWEADRHHILMYNSENNRIVHVESITHKFRGQ